MINANIDSGLNLKSSGEWGDFLGVRLAIRPLIEPIPKLKLRETFTACTEEGRASMNSFLLETFGTKEVAYMIGNDTMMCSNLILDVLRGLA